MAKRKKKTRQRTSVVAKKRERRAGRGRPRKLATVSLSDLQAEIHRRRSELQQRRDALTRELEELDRTLNSLGGAPDRGRARNNGTSTGRRGRPKGSRNKTSLTETLRSILKRRTLSVTDATEAVKATGYKSSSANFRAIVNHTLLTNPKLFRKVARGEYTAK